MQYVIIGNSAAGVGCVEGIRQADKTGKITVLSSEPYHTYSRPLISYLLYGKTDEEKMKYRRASFYEDNGCEFLPSRTAAAIDPKGKTVRLTDGTEIPYDRLMVATGSRPFVPPIPGLDRVSSQFTFMSLDDARALEKELSPDKRVLIMGAGLIGLKCAEGIAAKVGELTVVDLAPHILPSILDPDAAALVQKHIEGHNIRFILSDSVKEFSGNAAVLASGKTVPFDILIVAVGVRPNTALISDAGGAVNRGIVTDDACRTTLPDIFAAGDCTESRDAVSGEHRVLALLPNAYMQGECAGINMAGGTAVYDKAIAMNAIGFFGLHVLTAGSYQGEDYISAGEETYKRLISSDNRLRGFILVGDVARAGIYTNLIKNKTALSSIDYDLIKERPQLLAFSRKERKIMLGGAAE